MKLLFSEGTPDYTNYIFPYVIWAFPEQGEDVSRIFDAGFLPSSRLLDRFYMARQIRISLPNFALSSENRRVLRKCGDVGFELLPREKFNYSESRRAAFKKYADEKFGADVMTFERLDELFHSPMVTHVLQFIRASGEDAGTVALYLVEKRLAFYYYAFYDLEIPNRNLGIYMMTVAAKLFAEDGYQHLYLGTCYSEKALYKTQFKGAEFFNGAGWSGNMQELKFVLRRNTVHKHLLEDPEFVNNFCPNGTAALARDRGIRR